MPEYGDQITIPAANIGPFSWTAPAGPPQAGPTYSGEIQAVGVPAGYKLLSVTVNVTTTATVPSPGLPDSYMYSSGLNVSALQYDPDEGYTDVVANVGQLSAGGLGTEQDNVQTGTFTIPVPEEWVPTGMGADPTVYTPSGCGCNGAWSIPASGAFEGGSGGTISLEAACEWAASYWGLSGWGPAAGLNPSPYGCTDGQQTLTVHVNAPGQIIQIGSETTLPFYGNLSGLQFYVGPCDELVGITNPDVDWATNGEFQESYFGPTSPRVEGLDFPGGFTYGSMFAANDGPARSCTYVVETSLGSFDLIVNQDGSGAPPPQPGNGNGNRLLDADLFDDVLALAWIDPTTGKLYSAVHRAPIANIGNGTQGWEAPQPVEAANCANPLGLLFLPNSRLYLSYELSGAQVWRSHDAHGGSGSPNWSASASAGQSIACKGRSGSTGWIVQSGAPLAYARSQDLTGAEWTGGILAVGGAVGIGVAWVQQGLVMLYNDAAGGFHRALIANPEAVWPAATAVSGLAGQLVDLKCASHGALVGLLWDWDGTKTFKACRSRDLGQTWEMDDSPIAAIPALDIPPALVTQEHYVFAVWTAGNAPAFACTQDAGRTWT